MPRKLCSRCQRPEKVCYCHLLKPVANDWPVTLIQHVEESRHSIGTAKIAQLSLKRCQTQIVKDGEEYFQGEQQGSSLSPILVYPGEGSITLDEVKDGPVRPLVFLDASWRKSRQMFYQSNYLQSLPTLSFTFPESSRYRIRKEPRQGYCSTLEAIVFILKQLEKEPDRFNALLKVMDWMIDQQIAYMGREKFDHNYSK